jgi:hypothetical protein
MIDLTIVKPADLWYIVGLIVTDGNLANDGRHINITSKDESLLLAVKEALGLKCGLTKKSRHKEKIKKYFFLQFSDARFYRYLLTLSLHPKKSLTLKSVPIPALYFSDFVRGVIDGDGCITTWVHKQNGHIQWALTIVSASPIFINWLKLEIESAYKVKGKLYTRIPEGKNPLYTIKFGKLAAKVILRKCYYKNSLCLDRKLHIVQACLSTKNGMRKYGKVISH